MSIRFAKTIYIETPTGSEIVTVPPNMTLAQLQTQVADAPTSDVVFEAALAEETALATEIGAAISDYETALTNWETLSAAQKDAVLQRHTQVLVRLLRRVQAELTP